MQVHEHTLLAVGLTMLLVTTTGCTTRGGTDTSSPPVLGPKPAIGSEPSARRGAEVRSGVDQWSGPACCEVRAARVFAGPASYPPEAFAAYGVVAFPALAAEADRMRHELFCDAYLATLPHADELPGVPIETQMVTVWPIAAEEIVSRLDGMPRDALCAEAVTHYGLPLARRALRMAERSGFVLEDRGPYLLAWSPTNAIGEPDTPVLAVDLSDVTTYTEARDLFVDWARDIESDPNLWQRGFDREGLDVTIRRWADRYGRMLADLFAAGES